MAKTNMFCPFTHSLCDECALYRGRHYYLGFCKQYQDYAGKSMENAKSGVLHHSVDLQVLRSWVEPWGGTGRRPETELRVKLKVIDMDTGITRTCELKEAKTWEYNNPEMMILVGGIQITSWDKLVDLVSYKAQKGYQEVEVYEAPRFMLLGGG